MKHLTRHLDRLRACFAQLPDPRRGRNRQYAMQDIGLAEPVRNYGMVRPHSGQS